MLDTLLLGADLLVSRLFDLFFPDACAVCRRHGVLLCSGCRAVLRPHPDFAAPAGLDSAAVAFLYDGPLPRLLYRLKYDRRRRLAVPLGDLLAVWYHGRPRSGTPALIAVPLHRQRLQERGFNQALELARRVARLNGLPLVEGLVRTRDTGHQASLGRAARAVNLRDAFRWVGNQPPPRTVVLVDDVYTTGATMVACAEALRAAGTRRVEAIALARSDLQRSRLRHARERADRTAQRESA